MASLFQLVRVIEHDAGGACFPLSRNTYRNQYLHLVCLGVLGHHEIMESERAQNPAQNTILFQGRNDDGSWPGRMGN